MFTIRTWLLSVLRNNRPLPQEVVQTGSMASKWIIWWHESEYTVNKLNPSAEFMFIRVLGIT